MPSRIQGKKALLADYAVFFRRPLRLSPVARRQIGTTPIVKRFVGSFLQRNLSGITLIREIVKTVSGFEKVILDPATAQKFWAKRSGSEIIESEKIFYAKEEKGKRPTIRGCTDLAVAIASCLRALKIPATIARMQDHTYVKFFYKGMVWLINPPASKEETVRQMTTTDIRLERFCKAKKAFAECQSLSEIGLKSYEDFFKFEK